jgi:hypothetical protein
MLKPVAVSFIGFFIYIICYSSPTLPCKKQKRENKTKNNTGCISERYIERERERERNRFLF